MTDPHQKTPAPGMQLIAAEMEKQGRDARASFEANREKAGEIAAAIRSSGRLLMLGMGGSHAIGRTVEPLYRALGIDAIAMPASEQLGQPLPLGERTVLLTSQSGGSAEVLRWIEENPDHAPVFGLTLEADAALARSRASLVGSGGTELAFAATRSLTITLSLHGAILAALGMPVDGLHAALKQPDPVNVEPLVSALLPVRAIVTTGRHHHGIAEIIALGFTELARMPAYGLEGGQLRHGPMEMLGPDIGVIVFRGRDDHHGMFDSTIRSVQETGAPVVVLDASGSIAVPGVPTISLQPSEGIEASLRLLMAAQHLMTAFAALRVENPGTPVRSSKVTRSEE